MANLINADNGLVSGSVGLKYSCDNTGVLALQTSGNTAMTIDTSQNVGIGTTSTLGNSLLNVAQGVVARNVGATVGYFQTYNSTAGTDLKTWRIGGGSSGQLVIETVNDAYSAATERMRIDSSGNFGIGTTTPNIYSTSFARQFTASTTTASGYAVGTFAGGSGGSGGVEFGNQTVRQAGIYGLDGSALALYTNATNSGSGLTERMRINSTGDVGIGTTSPTDSAGFGRALDLNGSAGAALYTRTNGSATSWTVFGNYGVDGYINNRGAGTIQFYNNNAERMRITSDGFLKASNNGAYHSSTSTNHELRSTVDGNNVLWIIHGGTHPYGPYLRFAGASPNNASNYYFYCDDTTSARFIVYSNGNVVNLNGSYGAISDIKNKENIVDATPKLDDVMQLKVRNFNFKTDPDLKQIGFVAQEFEQVFPAMVEDTAEMVEGKPTGETSKTIKMSVLIPILTKAIQEQQAMIEELKQEVAALKENN